MRNAHETGLFGLSCLFGLFGVSGKSGWMGRLGEDEISRKRRQTGDLSIILVYLRAADKPGRPDRQDRPDEPDRPKKGLHPAARWQRRAGDADRQFRDVTLAEVHRVQARAIECAVGGMAEHDGFRIMPDGLDRPVGSQTIDRTGLVAGNIQPALRVEGQPVGADICLQRQR